MAITRRRWTPSAILVCGTCLFVGVQLLSRNVSPARENPQEMFPPAGPRTPAGLPRVIWPSKNRYSPEKAELGWLLFFDKRLSADGASSCATCHQPEKAFTDGQAVSAGFKGQRGGRSAPSLVN